MVLLIPYAFGLTRSIHAPIADFGTSDLLNGESSYHHPHAAPPYSETRHMICVLFSDRYCCTLRSRQSQCFSLGEKSPQMPLSYGRRSGSPSNIRLLGPPQVHVPNANSIESAVFSRLTLHGPYTLLLTGPLPTPKLLLLLRMSTLI